MNQIKKFVTKNPILFGMIFIYFILNVVDSVTAYFILPGESNPIFLLTGNIIFLYLYKLMIIIFMLVIYNKNHYKTNFIYYMFFIIIVLGIIGTSLACYANYYGMQHSEVLEQAQHTTTGEKINGYSTFVFIIFLLPMAICLSSYWLFDKSIKNVKIGEDK